MNQTILKYLAKIITGVLFIALFAQITITLPFNEAGIPVTGQSFAVLIMAYFYGRQDAVTVILYYLLLGGLGLPFFADGASGWEKFTGGSGGFLIGFVFAAAIMAYFGEKEWGRSFPKSVLIMTIGTFMIIIAGVSWLTKLYGFEKALGYGFYPFIWGGLIKIGIGAVIPPVYYYLKEKGNFINAR